MAETAAIDSHCERSSYPIPGLTTAAAAELADRVRVRAEADRVSRSGRARARNWMPTRGTLGFGACGGRRYDPDRGGGSPWPRQTCFWKVKVWDGGQGGRLSRPASWTMGSSNRRIGRPNGFPSRTRLPALGARPVFLPPARHYRKAFNVEREVRGRRFTVRHSLAEYHMNGRRGRRVFRAGWADSDAAFTTGRMTTFKSLRSQPHRRQLRRRLVGCAVGLLVGRAQRPVVPFRKTPALLVQLERNAWDGSHETIGHCAVSGDGPIREADSSWARPTMRLEDPLALRRPGLGGCSLAAPPWVWESPFRRRTTKHEGPLFAHRIGSRVSSIVRRGSTYAAPPIRVTQALPPGAHRTATGVFIYDFGQNSPCIVGSAKGPSGGRWAAIGERRTGSN